MTALCDRAELRRVMSTILHCLDSKMRGMPEDCLVEVWAMAHPQVEGFERASRICVFAEKGDGSPALDGGVLDLRTKTHRQGTSSDSFFWRLDYDEESLKLVLAVGPYGDAVCVHTTDDFLYVYSSWDDFHRFPRSLGFIRGEYDLAGGARSGGDSFLLRPWSADDRRRHAISSATSCDNAYIYATTNFWEGSNILVEIDVKHDIGRCRTIQSGDLYPVSATMLNGKAALFWLDGSHPRNAYKWSRGRGGPGAEDSCTPFLQHHGVEFSALTVSNQIGWLGVLLTEEERFWQVDLITETILAVFQSPSEPYDIYARPDGGLWAVLLTDSNEVLVEVWKPVLEPRPHKPIMMRRIVPTTTQS
ncbi:hypothetical protein FOZ63_029203 [Perkinsus olseni]|uniref:Uncharacterized protein n=1 Tax=Perkinsus olseni TaxID=32597 RepID=A0A7J6R874_PEROL|nr:hypothetical protein FOZ63_029203 [Perkinsus olseni]